MLAGGRLLDAGLQLERTQLAWSRTTLGLAVNAALMLRLARDFDPAVAAYAAAAVLASTSLGAWAYGRVSFSRRRARLIAGEPAARPAALRLLWALTSTATVAATAVTLAQVVS